MNKTFTIISVAEAFSALAESKGLPVSGFGFRSCPDAPYVECLLAGARASATDISPYRFLDGSGHWWSSCARVKITSPIAKGHNPQSLTEEQVGVSEGWRLLTVEEIDYQDKLPLGHATKGVEYYSDVSPARFEPPIGSGGWRVIRRFAFRTKHPEGYYLPKPVIAEGFNPHSLTVEQVGEGYRLLTKEEIEKCSVPSEVHDYWDRFLGGWQRRCGASISRGLLGANDVYRTQKPAGYYLLPKVPQYVPWTFDTAPKGFVLLRPKCNARINHYPAGWSEKRGLLFRGGHVAFADLLTHWEASLDGGKTWSPAATEVRS